jgi:uncharacterized protein YbbC (DUF1343 family)
MPVTRFGLDKWIDEEFVREQGSAIGVVCNQASVASDLKHVVDHLLPAHRDGTLKIQAVFGPQHGLWGETQDNMVEWEGGEDPRTGLRVYSLYGEHREPTPDMLAGVERLFIDLPDVGARYYTFASTMALCMKACEASGIPVTVLDRPNPLSGSKVEGPVLDSAYASFVGMYPLPTRHGMTMGEIANYIQTTYMPKLRLRVETVLGWHRAMWADETEIPWVMPSPNMPTLETAIVYPGTCLLEGTNVSEGRGTTRPFEIFGAPFADGWRLADNLNRLRLSGVAFRPVQFLPTFGKYVGKTCQGVFIHVLDRAAFKPVLTGIAILQELIRTYPGDFAWKEPPYEYEEVLMPIDILAGVRWLRPAVEQGAPLREIAEQMAAEVHRFAPMRGEALLY